MAGCPNCGQHVARTDYVKDTQGHALHLDAKTAVLFILGLYGLASWVILALSVPAWARRITEPIGYEEWLSSVLAIPAIRAAVIIGAIVGLVVFYVEALSLMRNGSGRSKKVRKYRCPACGHSWDR